ncbi:hypothetical protein FRC12_005934 [Ceratobasidium sp. 428]|nr:hypothetical protein FRC12_005934 [Ceratobasidium sp. 428]
MAAALFEILPADTLLVILSLLPGSSIRQCLQVCRLFNDLIRSSDYLKYLLELDACGYIRPNRIRADLSYREMIKLLRDHKARWNNPQKVVPTYYELPIGYPVESNPLSKGVFTMAAKRNDGLVDQIHFFQLPSKNKGTGFEHWHIGLEVLLWDFLVDPDQDLLVGLEQVHATPTTKVHLKSMRTNVDHPKSVSGQFTIARRFYDDFDSSVAEVIGHSLAVFGRSQVERSFCAEIWDWTTGQRLSYLDLNHINARPGHLLSENSFVVCISAPFDSGADFLENALGCLDVYQFGLYDTMPARAVHVASFALPPGENADLTCRSAQSTFTRGHDCSAAKVYDLEPQDRPFYVGISTRRGKTASLGSLCTSVSTLFGALPSSGFCRLDQHACALIPWVDWANKTSWIIWDDFNAGRDIRFCDQRSASLGDDERSLAIINFRQGRRTAWNIDGQDISDLMRDQERAHQRSDCVDQGQAAGDYQKALWNPRGSEQSRRVDIDDEHVVILLEVFV